MTTTDNKAYSPPSMDTDVLGVGASALAADIVQFLFQLALKRDPGNAGLSFHVRELLRGTFSVSAMYVGLNASREYIVRAAQDNVFTHLMDFRFHGSTLRISPYSPLAQEIESKEGYEPWCIPYFLELCRPGMTVLDMGASWGVYSIPAAARVGPMGKVYAVEANARNSRLLLQNARLNQADNLILLAIAASDKVGHVLFPAQTVSNTNAISSNHDLADIAGFDVVASMPLDLILPQDSKVDLVKIDIDGADYLACLGARRLLDEGRPVVFLEYCPQLLAEISQIDPPELLRFFGNRGYTFEILHRHRARELLHDKSLDQAIARIIEVCSDTVVFEGGTHIDLCCHPH